MQFLIKFYRSCIHMNQLSVLCFLVLSAFQVHGQVGLKLVGTMAQNKIAETTSNEKLFSTKFGAGVDYWFRLKKYRLEFLPAIHYQFASENLTFTDQTTGRLDWSVIDFAPGFQIYPLDFFNDCQCPTFSKQGQFLKKGLFLHFAPGIALSTLKSDLEQLASAKDWIGFVRLGLGLDIGFSDLITISPSLSYQLSQTLDWSAYFQSESSRTLNINSGLFLSVRVGFRLDKNRY